MDIDIVAANIAAIDLCTTYNLLIKIFTIFLTVAMYETDIL